MLHTMEEKTYAGVVDSGLVLVTIIQTTAELRPWQITAIVL